MSEASSRKQILLYGIGAQKAGTTWLHEQLARQDDVFMALPKELHYWDFWRPPYREQNRTKARFRRWPTAPAGLRGRLRIALDPRLRQAQAEADRYQALYEGNPHDHSDYLDYVGVGRVSARLVGDITPSYAMLGRDTFAEMLKSAADVRFVFVMRDPVRRLWSGITQHNLMRLRKGIMSPEDLCRSFHIALGDRLSEHWTRSDYARTITELEAAVPAERIHYTFFETLFDPVDSAAPVAELARFLECTPEQFNSGELVQPEVKGRAPARKRPKVSLPREDYVVARERLAPVYEFIADRFGSDIVKRWDAAA